MDRPVFLTIMARIAEGETLLRICKDDGMPDRSTIQRYILADKEAAAINAQARELQGDVMDERVLEVAQKVESGKIKPDAGRVILNALQWRAERLNARAYGNKIAVDQTIRQDEAKRIEQALIDGRKRLALARTAGISPPSGSLDPG